jgi:deoxycytidine triphosphate deaminase
MILVDKDIRRLAADHKLIIEGYEEEKVGSISCDLTVDEIICGEEGHSVAVLEPGAVVFVKTKEKLCIPENIIGRIAQKNSRMRMGLYVDGPHYHPGHETYAFLRVWNISSNQITIERGQEIAQIIFEQLTQRPDKLYGQDGHVAFVNETEYRGLSTYKKEYEKYVQRIEKVSDNLDSKETQIYANVLTLMGIVAAVFAIITLNFEAFAKVELNVKFILTMNLSLVLALSVFFGLLHIVINKEKKKWFDFLYVAILALLVIALILVYIFL